MRNWRLHQIGLAEPGETPRFVGMGPGLECHDVAGRDFGRVWNWTDLFFQTQPGPLADYPDPLLTLSKIEDSNHINTTFPT